MQRREVARYMVAFLFDGTASGLPAALTPLVSESTVSEQELLEPESGGVEGIETGILSVEWGEEVWKPDGSPSLYPG